MTSSDSSDTETVHWLDAINGLVTVAIFVTVVIAALVGAFLGEWMALVLIPIGWIFAAFDPHVGRWKHVWE